MEKKGKQKENEGAKGKGERPARTGLATSWHHFTWPPPQHQATQNPRASFWSHFGLPKPSFFRDFDYKNEDGFLQRKPREK